jgi:segregation and condensation protein A
MATNDYKVELEVFEGPLDLLLYLIKKDEVDIYDIPIEIITAQYMEYLNLMRLLDLNIAGEFIVMAATLMLIKSRMLLPVEERPEMEEEEEDDPRWELVRQLVEYKKFKDAAARLQDNELHQEDIFGIGGQVLSLATDESSVVLQDVSIFDLIAAFDEVIKNAVSNEIGEIIGDSITVADKIDHILNVVKENESVTFTSLFQGEVTRNGIICTFLALLELTRLRQLNIAQSDTFGEIMISGNDEEDDTYDDTNHENSQQDQEEENNEQDT